MFILADNEELSFLWNFDFSQINLNLYIKIEADKVDIKKTLPKLMLFVCGVNVIVINWERLMLGK